MECKVIPVKTRFLYHWGYLSHPPVFLILSAGYVNDDLIWNPFDLIQVLCIICLGFCEQIRQYIDNKFAVLWPIAVGREEK